MRCKAITLLNRRCRCKSLYNNLCYIHVKKYNSDSIINKFKVGSTIHACTKGLWI